MNNNFASSNAGMMSSSLPAEVMNWRQGQPIPQGWRLARQGYLKPTVTLPPHLQSWQQGQPVPEGYRVGKRGMLRPRDYNSKFYANSFNNYNNFGATGVATPCHPITGAVGAAAPASHSLGNPTIEQATTIPTSTHMYGVPVATFEKTGKGGRSAPAIPIATAATGPLNRGPVVTSTVVETHTVPATAVGAAPLGQPLSNTVVNDSYSPVDANTTAPGTVIPGPFNALGAAGIHKHDRAHHHHVHDHLPGMSTAAAGSALSGNTATSSTAAPASGGLMSKLPFVGHKNTTATTTPATSGAAPASGGLMSKLPFVGHKSTDASSASTTGRHGLVGSKGDTPVAPTAKPMTNEHQIIQDVIPPGRNRIVEHHEKF